MSPSLLLLALASGATTLVYEVVWAKFLALSLGGTALAQTVVLAAFLGGLSLGNALLGARADREALPLSFYGKLELAIALAGLASPAALSLLGKGGAAGILLFAFLMGGTLPALARTAAGRVGEGVSRLYAANCAGAVLGALAAGFLLIPSLGLDRAAYAAAGLDAAAGLAALGLASRGRGKAPAARAERALRGTFRPRDAAAVVFLSGAVTLVYEVAWIRLLSLVMGSSAYSFSVMLAAFISGIALGSRLVSSKRLRDVPPAALFALAQLGAAGAVLLTVPLYDRLPFYFLLLRDGLGEGRVSFQAFEAVKFLLCFALTLGPTCFLGMAVPTASALAAPEARSVGRTVGGILAANALGNVLGAAAGLLLMPALGLEGLIFAGAAVNAALGLGVLWAAPPWKAGRKRALAAACLAVLGIHQALVPSWDKLVLSYGTYRYSPPERFSRFRDFRDSLRRDASVPYYRDDRNATVSVIGFRDGSMSLKVNGKSDASNGDDMLVQILLAQLPLLLKPASEVLIVGWGSGVTAGSALRHPLKRLDIAEISPAMIEASELFKAESGDPRSDPRLAVHLEDAKTFLAGASRYDVIVNEPSNPWMAGVANLFTAEFYARARRALKPGGLMAQWFHLYEMDDDSLRLVLRTFAAGFPHVSLWNLNGVDVLILGSDSPLAPDARLLDAAFARPGVQDDLGRIDLRHPASLLALQSASDKTVRELAGPGPVNEDRFPRLEYAAPKAFFRREFSHLLDGHDDREGPETRQGLLLAGYLKARGRPLSADELSEILSADDYAQPEAVARAWLDEWLKRFPADPRAWFRLYLHEKQLGDRAKALAALRRAARLDPADKALAEMAARPVW